MTIETRYSVLGVFEITRATQVGQDIKFYYGDQFWSDQCGTTEIHIDSNDLLTVDFDDFLMNRRSIVLEREKINEANLNATGFGIKKTVAWKAQ